MQRRMHARTGRKQDTSSSYSGAESGMASRVVPHQSEEMWAFDSQKNH